MKRLHLKPTKQHSDKLVKQSGRILWWLSLALLIYMPLHVFLAQSLSQATGGLEVWKIAKDGVVVAGAGLAALVLTRKFFKEKFGWLHKIAILGGAYLLIHLIFLIFVDLDGESALLATVYNNRLLALLFIGLAGGTWISRNSQKKDAFIKILYWAGTVLAVLAVIQYFLPGDFLENFGYSIERGARAFFGIDSKADLPRVFATLRDPNSFGALLIITLSLSIALFVNKRAVYAKLNKVSLAAIPLQLLALFLTFSRSAWLGAAAALIFIAWQVPRIRAWFKLKNIILITAFLAFLFIAAYPTIKESYFLENIIFHSDETTTELGSTQKHAQYVLESAKEALSEPLGHGPGTAGIVSIRNERGTVLPENYYVQIAYEVGVVGLGLFLALNALVYKKLHSLPHSSLRLALLASFWGLIVTNMLLHTWSNEAVATFWWLSVGYLISASREH